MLRTQWFAAMLVIASSASAVWAASPQETVFAAHSALHEALTTSGAEIPASLLADAHGVAIVPGVIKVGFIGAIRRGHGVVMVKDERGNWGPPQFITLTGGSVGWQIGASSTDVILVFNSQRSVQGMLKGKFTIGADAAAAAGPVGRNLAAATDAQLKAEILSYSRSRGLFAGVSIDGSAIEIDHTAAAWYYAARPGEQPQVPEGGVKLVEAIASIGGAGVNTELAPRVEERALRIDNLDAVRAELAQSAAAMNALLEPQWQRYLALPATVYDSKQPASPQAVATSLANYERVATAREYAALHQRAEFQKTIGLLRAYHAALAASRSKIDLPPPPR